MRGCYRQRASTLRDLRGSRPLTGERIDIGIDGTIWGGEESGVAAATRRLVLELAALPSRPRLTVYLAPAAERLAQQLGPDARVHFVPLAGMGTLGRLLWQHTRLPHLVRSHGLDVLYCPAYTAPVLFRPRSVVLSVHDLIVWSRPDVCRYRNRVHLRTLVPPSIRRARVILVPTDVVAQDLRSRLAVPAAKIRVLPWAADREIEPVPRAQARVLVERWFGVGHRYVLFMGGAEPKKNLRTAIEAVERMGGCLVAVGSSRWGTSDLLGAAEGRATRHRFLGYVPVDRLGALLAGADALIFPSHAEGFGLPTLESMACGTPVVASDDPALREVCGGAALHSPATDARSLAESLATVCKESPLREEMIRRGRERAAQFRWERSAAILLQALLFAARPSAGSENRQERSESTAW